MKARRGLDIFIAIIFVIFAINYGYKHFLADTKNKSSQPLPIIRASHLLARKAYIPPNAINLTATSSACTFFS